MSPAWVAETPWATMSLNLASPALRPATMATFGCSILMASPALNVISPRPLLLLRLLLPPLLLLLLGFLLRLHRERLLRLRRQDLALQGVRDGVRGREGVVAVPLRPRICRSDAGLVFTISSTTTPSALDLPLLPQVRPMAMKTITTTWMVTTKTTMTLTTRKLTLMTKTRRREKWKKRSQS